MMTLNEYQEQARVTDQHPERSVEGDVVPLLGLAGEVGSLLTEYKKKFRDGDAYRVFRERISEELGDILWYTATVASRAGLDLASVAAGNLAKVRSRWMPQLEYREWERCGHHPWREKAVRDEFFAVLRQWLGQHLVQSR